MKKILFFIFLFTLIVHPQIDFRASMGLNFVSMPNLRDYINGNYAPSDEQLGTFNSAVEFGGEASYELIDYQFGIDIAYEMSSFTYPFFGNKYEFAYGTLHASASLFYLMKGTGYKFRFGGGAGPSFLSIDETLPVSTIAQTYSSTGMNLFLRSDGQTKIGTHTFAYIGLDFRYAALGEPKKNSQSINPTSPLKISSATFGIKLGVVYQL